MFRCSRFVFAAPFSQTNARNRSGLPPERPPEAGFPNFAAVSSNWYSVSNIEDRSDGNPNTKGFRRDAELGKATVPFSARRNSILFRRRDFRQPGRSRFPRRRFVVSAASPFSRKTRHARQSDLCRNRTFAKQRPSSGFGVATLGLSYFARRDHDQRRWTRVALEHRFWCRLRDAAKNHDGRSGRKPDNLSQGFDGASEDSSRSTAVHRGGNVRGTAGVLSNATRRLIWRFY